MKKRYLCAVSMILLIAVLSILFHRFQLHSDGIKSTIIAYVRDHCDFLNEYIRMRNAPA